MILSSKRTILYMGGFQLPDKNAAAQRVIGIAKGLRYIGYNVVFLNSLKNYDSIETNEKEYYGFKCFEYKREKNIDYMISAKTSISMIKKIKPYAVIAYNYPAVALYSIVRYCRENEIKCFADATEWYDSSGGNIIYKFVKWLDTCLRMRYVHKSMDGVIAISRFLYDYYKDSVKTVLIPPTVDIRDSKWNVPTALDDKLVSFVYAGVPSVTKERLDRIVSAVGVVEQEHKIRLDIVGITKEQFTNLYTWKESIPESVVFWGRVEHKETLNFVKKANWSIILRPNNRITLAGFPTKLVESISCGTPVLSNQFSNVFDYLTKDNSICVKDINNIADYMIMACDKVCTIDRTIFDYHNYLSELEYLLHNKRNEWC